MIIFPVGHYTGTQYPGVDQPLAHRSVRIGKLSLSMLDESAFAVWAAAHRPPDRAGDPWTRESVSTLARTLRVDDPDKIIDEYLDDGVLAELMPHTDDAIEFAKAHRVVPTMLGLGTTPDEPLTTNIGLFGMAPIARVSILVYDVWLWGGSADNLWTVCETFARAGAAAAVEDVREHDPAWVLGTFLEDLQGLVSVNAAYIDEAR